MNMEEKLKKSKVALVEVTEAGSASGISDVTSTSKADVSVQEDMGGINVDDDMDRIGCTSMTVSGCLIELVSRLREFVAMLPKENVKLVSVADEVMEQMDMVQNVFVKGIRGTDQNKLSSSKEMSTQTTESHVRNEEHEQ